VSLDEQIRAMVAAEIDPLRRELDQLRAANQRSSEPLGFTVAELATKVLPGVPESTIREWIKCGDLPAHFTPGGRVYLVMQEDLRTFLASLPGRAAGNDVGSVDESVRRIMAKNRKLIGS
jgi:excisionase family DNA binding protein